MDVVVGFTEMGILIIVPNFSFNFPKMEMCG